MGVGTQTWTYTYDANKAYRLSTVAQLVGGVATPVTYGYNGDGSVNTLTYGNGSTATYSYDSNGRGWLKKIDYKTSSGTLQQSISEDYYPNGVPKSYGNAVIGTSPLNSTTWSSSYGYDYANRLTSESRTGGSTGNFSYTYGYDGAGNRTSKTNVLTNSTVTYSFGAGDAFLKASDSSYVVTTNSATNYDADGNPTLFQTPTGTLSLSYDTENQVKTVGYSNGSSDSFGYNSDNQRVQKTDPTGSLC